MNPLTIRPHPNPYFPILPYFPNAYGRRRLSHSSQVHLDPLGGIQNEEDLASVSVQVEKKRFYVDVKKNPRGIFMKIAEVGFDGRKARILLTLHAAFEIKDKLKDLISVLDEIQKKESTEQSEQNGAETKPSESQHIDGLIKSHIVSYAYRRYFLDLKHNSRGYFLRLTMLSSLNRIQLVIPSQGMLDLYNAINDLLDKWWNGSKSDDVRVLNLPKSKALRVDNKTLYFDSSFNRFGAYLRISEVRTASRTAITIPGSCIDRFKDIINDLAEELSNTKVDETEEKSSPNDTVDTNDSAATSNS